MLSARPAEQPALYVTTSAPEAQISRDFGEDLIVIDATKGSPFSEPVMLEQAIVTAAKGGANRIVIDGLEVFSRRWGTNRAIGFFKRVCPRLFDLGTIAYWRAPRATLGNAGIDEIRKVTQCVFELSDKQLRVLKVEGHSAMVQGRLFRVSRDEEMIHLHAERALGRLAQGLRTIRVERSLSQTDVARLAEVSPSALSQAEAGLRGLSLNTLLTLTSRLRSAWTTYSRTSRSKTMPSPVGTGVPSSAPASSCSTIPRRVCASISLTSSLESRGVPPVTHKGAELVLVAEVSYSWTSVRRRRPSGQVTRSLRRRYPS